MNSFRTTIRTSPAVWFAIPIAVFAAWYVTLLPIPQGYGVAATGAATGTLPFIGAFVGGTAAWEGSRLRRGAIWGGPWPRNALQIGLGVVGVPIGAGWLLFAVAVVVALVTTSSFPPDPVMVAIGALDVIAYAAIGFAIGVTAPAALAIPTATLLPLLWLAFVPAMHPVWLRHLTGMFRDCCGLAEALSPRAELASIALDTGFIVSASIATLVAVTPRRRAVNVVAVLTVAAAIGITTVRDMTYAPVVARDPAALQCSSEEGAEICLWPEDAVAEPQLEDLISEVRAAWREADVPAPRTFTEALAPPGPDVAPFRLPNPLTRDLTILALADALVPPTVECPVISAEGVAGLYLRGWYAAAGGLSDESLSHLDLPADETNKSLIDTVRDLRSATPAARARWVASATQATKVCTDVAPDLRVAP
jgi:hypothetical protein